MMHVSVCRLDMGFIALVKVLKHFTRLTPITAKAIWELSFSVEFRAQGVNDYWKNADRSLQCNNCIYGNATVDPNLAGKYMYCFWRVKFLRCIHAIIKHSKAYFMPLMRFDLKDKQLVWVWKLWSLLGEMRIYCDKITWEHDINTL